MTKPDIYEFMDCALYLQNVYQWRRAHESGFSFAVWAAELGFTNKTILRFILQGKRRVSPASAAKIRVSLQLKAEESAYFDALVAYSQARTPAQKNLFGSELIRFQRARYRQTEVPPPRGAYAELSPLILTLLSFSDIQWSVTKVASATGFAPEAVAEVLKELTVAGLAEESGGVYSGGPDALRIFDHFRNDGLRKYYEHWIDRSKSSIDLPFEVRRYRSLMVALDRNEFEKLVEKINAFALELLSQHHSGEITGKNLYMLNAALFPVAGVS